jgi:hypothetical protein
VAVIGAGDPEMTRDSHSLFPVKAGGRADLYLRSDLTYGVVSVPVTATLQSKVGAVGTWQFALGASAAPGFYEVRKVLFPGEAASDPGFLVSLDQRGVDMTGSGWHPDIPIPPGGGVPVEGVYSAYQTGTFQFQDTVTDASSLTPGVSTKAYAAVVTAMPNIGTAQVFWNSSAHRPRMGDILVKAPIPCFVSVAFSAHVPVGTTVDTGALVAAVSTAINKTGFPGSLSASLIGQAVHNANPAITYISNFALSGRLRFPDGTINLLVSDVLLTIPSVPAKMTTGNTVAFLTDPSQITISVISP